LGSLVTQPYDKISPAMRTRYLSLSPYNLVRVILGEPSPADTSADNVYTRASANLAEWIGGGILARDREPGVFPYFQEFTEPDTGERLVRKGFIALGGVEDYSAGIVHRHEQTLSGPKKDRMELLRHTHAHCEQLFMLYPDPAGAVDALLDAASASAPLAEVTDEYGVIHRVWKIAGPAAGTVQSLMADKKLLIADGHHRYETALAFRNQNPALDGADRVVMTFVNMHSPGLRNLATHRLASNLGTGFPSDFLRAAESEFRVTPIDSLDKLKQAWAAGGPTVIGAAIGESLYLLEHREAAGDLDVRVLHERVLGKLLGIGAEAVRDEKHLRYMRGLEAAVEQARTGAAQAAFLLKPVSVEQVAATSFAGGVMPQKSTDFYPKLLSGLTIYKL